MKLETHCIIKTQNPAECTASEVTCKSLDCHFSGYSKGHAGCMLKVIELNKMGRCAHYLPRENFNKVFLNENK